VLENRPTKTPTLQAIKDLLATPEPQYTPAIKVPLTEMRVLWRERDPLSLFMRFSGEASLVVIIKAINTRAKAFFSPI
jgi:hypothetical protein